MEHENCPFLIRPEMYTFIYEPIRNCCKQNYNWLNCPVVNLDPKFRKSTSLNPHPSPTPSHLSVHLPTLGTQYAYSLCLSQYFFKKGSKKKKTHKASKTQSHHINDANSINISKPRDQKYKVE